MLQTIGAASIEDLLAQTLPADIRQREPLDVGPALSESQALATARAVAAQNVPMTSLIGQGYYGTILPPVIQRNILENPAWYTAYTPYQPEISQGRLEALLNFQTMVADLTGLEIANASLLDEATAAAEAMAMAHRIADTERTAFFVDQDCHPQTIAVLKTRAEALGWQISVGDPMGDLGGADVFGAMFQYPGTFGDIRDLRAPIARLKAAKAISVVAADPLALTLLSAAGRTRRRHRDRLHAALRRADGLWRPARGLYRHPRCAQARAARPHRRRLDRQPRQPRLSACAADARAAHPPREGDVEHLHRAGAAGGGGVDVCGLSRPRRAARDCPPQFTR